MKKIILLAVLAILAGCTGSHLPRAAAPCDTTPFDSMFNVVQQRACDELHGIMVLQHGKVIYEKYGVGYGPGQLHVMWSASKTFTAAAVGFARQENLLKLDDKIVKFFTPEELPAEPSEWLKNMTIKDLLTMSGGFSEDHIARSCGGYPGDWAAGTLNLPILTEPGTRFRYNSMETYLLSVIVSRVCGEKIVDYLEPRLFKPLGIRNKVWKESPQGYNCGGWGLYLSLEDLSKVGQWFLQRGEWKGSQLLEKSWFDEAMSAQIIPDPENPDPNSEGKQGYGYQMWVCTHDSYRMDGAWGQLCIICPEKDLVVTIFEHSSKTHNVIKGVWKYIYDKL